MRFFGYFEANPVPFKGNAMKIPVCVDDLTYVGHDAVQSDIANFKAALGIFDPDPDAEDGVLDGIVSEPCADGACDGISVLEGQCSAKIARNWNDRKLESHAIRIRLDAGFDCRVSVWVKTSQTHFTVKRPNRRPEYEPTKCTVVKALASGSIYDTVSLDEGHKVYEVAQRIRILGPDDSLQLTPNRCDE